jgi:phosphoserine phosphatase
MTKILLIRHGHVEGIKPERFRGREPLELTDQGRAEAAAVANRIAGRWQPRGIYTSPLSRCVKTAEAVAEACAVAAQICDDLNDTDYGAWQFKTFHQAKAENPILFAAWFATPHLVRFPEGESLQDVAARTANALRFVLARHNDETIVLVAHDSVNRVLLLQFLGLPLASYWCIEQGPCCVNEIDIENGLGRVLRLNETHHLETITGHGAS